MTYRCSPGRDIVYKDKFTSTSANRNNDVRVFAVDADGQELLINGKSSFLVKLEPSPSLSGNNDDGSRIQQLVVSKTCKCFSILLFFNFFFSLRFFFISSKLKYIIWHFLAALTSIFYV